MTARWLLISIVIASIAACRSFADPSLTVREDDHDANYLHIFGQPRPEGIAVIHSVLIGDEFEIELLVPADWLKTRKLRPGDASAMLERKDRSLRPWYAPKAIDRYDLYTELASDRFLHVLVDRELVGSAKRVFLSKR